MTDEGTPGAFGLLHPVVQHHVVNTLNWLALRPLQEQAVEPLLAGSDALLIAPTAGGKTEAAMLPLLTRMEAEQWTGTSVIYVCPLKALLNNLEPRLSSYAAWLGRAAAVRHGDTRAADRKRQAADLPSVLLTTPESIEAMLVSKKSDPARLFGRLRAVVVDEVHAFAGDDRGWHLLAVIERLARLAGCELQRIGLSATVGNPEELLRWLQGPTERPGRVIAPPAPLSAPPEITLDFVGTVANAATMVAGLHAGEKRLVFADSRQQVEDLAVRLRHNGIDTHVSHSSVSVEARQHAEAAFAQSRDCVIVATSALELGLDVGDLDRVIQLGAPQTVASVWQRLGRTGRRPGTSRNLLVLGSDDDDFLRAAGLLVLLGDGFVEPITAPPQPLHIAAQQMLGLALQRGRIAGVEEVGRLAHLGLGDPVELHDIFRWLVAHGYLDMDQGLAFVGPSAERRYGRRNFMELLAVFTSDPEIVAWHGRQHLGGLDPLLLMAKVDGPRIVSLGGRTWEVVHIDWRRKRAQLEPSDQLGRSRWSGTARAYSYELGQAIRHVLLGTEPAGVHQTARAQERLARLRAEYAARVHLAGTVVSDDDGQPRWWTFAGYRANAVLLAALAEAAPEVVDSWSLGNLHVSLRAGTTPAAVTQAMAAARDLFGDDLAGAAVVVTDEALRKLKFADLLAPEVAVRTLAARAADVRGAAITVNTPIR